MGAYVTERDVKEAERKLDALLTGGADEAECLRAYDAYDRLFQAYLANLGQRRKRWSIRNTLPVAFCPF